MRDDVNWLTWFHRWTINQLIVVGLILLSSNCCVNYSNGFKYISLDSTNQRINVTLDPEFDQLNNTITDNTITDNDSEEGHAKVVKTISTLLAESLNKSIGHFQYIQDVDLNHNNQGSSESSEESESSESSGLRLPLISNKSSDKKVPCSNKISKSNRNDSSSESVILDYPTENGYNNSILSVTLTSSSSKSVADQQEDEIKSTSSSSSSPSSSSDFNPTNLVTQVTGLSKSTVNRNIGSIYYDEDEDDDTEDEDGENDENEDNQQFNRNHNYNSDKINLRNYFKLKTKSSSPIETVTNPSPVYQPEGYDESRELIKTRETNIKIKGDHGLIKSNHDRKKLSNNRKGKKVNSNSINNTTQFICIKVIDGKVNSPILAKQIYPQLKESSLIMPTIPKIPMSYQSYKRYLVNNETAATINGKQLSYNGDGNSSNLNGTKKSTQNGNTINVRRGKTYSQRYYPINLVSLDSIKSLDSVNYTLTSTLSFGDNVNSSSSDYYVGNNQRRISSTINETSSSSDIDYGYRSGSSDKKVTFKPITYKTTVIIPKITTTTVSLSTNYPKLSSESTTKMTPTTAQSTTTTPMPSTSVVTSSSSSLSLADIPELLSNKIALEAKNKSKQSKVGGKDHHYHTKESKSSGYHNANKKGDKSNKKEIQLINLGSSISPQRFISSRIRFPDPNEPQLSPTPLSSIDSSFDSFELTQPPEEPIIIPNSLIRPTFGLTTIGQSHHQQLTAPNLNPYTNYQQNPHNYHHHLNPIHHHHSHQQQQQQQQQSHQQQRPIQQQIQFSPQQLTINNQQPVTSNQYNLNPEIIPTSTLVPNDLTESPLIGLISPLSSSYKGLASKIKSAINFSTKQQQSQPLPPQSSQQQKQPQVQSTAQIYQHNHQAHNPYPFNYNSYEQPTGYETIYGKLNSPDLLYTYDPRLTGNYNKPESNLVQPYLTNVQGSFVRQPASKLLRQYQALVTSASSIVQRHPPQAISPTNHLPHHRQQQQQNHHHHQPQSQSNRQQSTLISQSSPTFYPVFQPVQSLPLNPHSFVSDAHQIAQFNSAYNHPVNHHLLNNQQLRPSGKILSLHHRNRLQVNHLTPIESISSSSSQSKVIRDTPGGAINKDEGEIIGISSSSSSSSSPLSTDDTDKQSIQSSTVSSSNRKSNKSKTGSSRNRNSKSKSKRKSRRSSLTYSPLMSIVNSSSSSSSSSPNTRTNYNPCSSTNCQQSTGGLLFNPSRSVKFELRDALP